MDYNTYHFTKGEIIRYFLEGLIIIGVVGELFYESLIGTLLISPMLLLYLKLKRIKHIKERRWRLNLEFRDGIISLLAALNAGYSSEHAFEETVRDLENLYQKNALIMEEFYSINNQLKMNITVEQALTDLGNRSGVEDIVSFAEIFATAKRTGGDLIRVIKTTCNTINDKIEIKREIVTLVTAKQFEANIMKLIPVGILLYMRISSPGYLSPLYHNLSGVLVMTALLMVYLGAYLLIDKITDIEL